MPSMCRSIPQVALATAAMMVTMPAAASDTVMSAAHASEVREIFLFHEMFFEACGRQTGDTATYREVWTEWARRNYNDGAVANRVLDHHKVRFQPDRFRDANTTAIRMSLGDAKNTLAYCALSGLAVGKGNLDVRKRRPDLFDMLVRSDRALRAKAQ